MFVFIVLNIAESTKQRQASVLVRLGEHSATLLNPKGGIAECWNGGQMGKYRGEGCFANEKG